MRNIFRTLLICGLVLVCVGCDVNPGSTERIEQAREYLAARDLNAASIVLKSLLQEEPDNAEARLLLGRVYLQVEDFPAAKKELQRAGDLGAAPQDYLPAMAQMLEKTRNNDDLQRLSLAELDEGEALAVVLAAKAMGSFWSGNEDQSKAQIDEAVAIAPDALYVQLINARIAYFRWEEDFARADIEKILAVDPTYAPAWSLLGDIEAYAGNLEEAEKAYTQAIRNHARGTLDSLNRAKTRLRLGNLAGAQSDLDAVLKRYPNNPEVNYVQGRVYLDQEEYQRASDSFQQTLSILEDHPEALYNSAIANRQLGNRPLARENAERFHTRAPDQLSGRTLLAIILLEAREPAKAVELLSPVVGSDHGNSLALKLLANAYLLNGEPLKAVPLMRRLLELEPDSIEARMHLALALKNAGLVEDALREIEVVLETDPGSRQAYQILVATYVEMEDYDSAMDAVDRFETSVPDSLPARHLKASVLLSQGEKTEAIELLKQIDKQQPGERSANQALARIATSDKDYTLARNYYENVLAAHPNDLTALMGLVGLDAIERRPDDMEVHLKQAVASHPQALRPRLALARYYFATGKLNEAQPLVEALPEDQREIPQALALRALLAFSEERYTETRGLLLELIRAEPKSVEGHYMLGFTYGRLGENVGMEEQFKISAELKPRNIAVGGLYVSALIRNGKGDLARSELTRLESLSPDSTRLKALRAILESEAGEDEIAEMLFSELYDLDPSASNMYALFGQLWKAGDQEQAIALKENWVGEHPEDVAAAQSLAGAYLRSGKIEQAVSSFEKLVAEDADNPVALNELAWLLREKESARAVEYARRANELAPGNAAILDTLAMALYHNGNLPKAYDAISRALDVISDNPTLLYHSAVILSAQGESERAVSVLESILSEASDFDEKAQAEALLKKLESL